MSARYVQFGCGLWAPEGWDNFDCSPRLWAQRLPVLGRFLGGEPRFPSNVRYGDIIKGLPVENGTCAGVYSSHVLEHLTLTDCRTAIRNVHKMLMQGGVFRLVVPDLRVLASRYVERTDDPEAAHEFMKSAYLGEASQRRPVQSVLKAVLGNSKHLWMYDEASLSEELRQAGFSHVRRAECGDATDPMFSRAEEEGRWAYCLGLEGRKSP